MPAQSPDPIRPIPLAEIDAESLSRDRISHDEAELLALRLSIARHGLRLPIEVFELAEPAGPHRYGLISGYRRLAAFRALAATTLDAARFAAIPAFVRAPRDAAEAYVQMVEENAIRAGISPWEQAMVAVKAARAEAYGTIDAAIEALYGSLGRHKRARIRTVATVVDELDGYLTTPELLPLRHLLRLAPLIPRGYGDLLRATLRDADVHGVEDEWRLLLPIIAEAERPEPSGIAGTRPGRPRRLLVLPARGLTIRREITRRGWCLHFTGTDATGTLLDAVFDEIERIFAPAVPGEPGKHLRPRRLR
jgi:ParB family chromosome partitioning protein